MARVTLTWDKNFQGWAYTARSSEVWVGGLARGSQSSARRVAEAELRRALDALEEAKLLRSIDFSVEALELHSNRKVSKKGKYLVVRMIEGAPVVVARVDSVDLARVLQHPGDTIELAETTR